MTVRTVPQLAWGHCRRCRRPARHARDRAIWPAGPPGWRRWLRLKLHDLVEGRWHCLECGQSAGSGGAARAEAPIELRPLEDLLS
jgi:hypothetical protein